MTNKATYIYLSIFVIAIIPAVFLLPTSKKSEYSNLEEFAKCLTEKQFTMYGAEWCTHCKAEKDRFGDSFKFVSYIECPENINMCLAKGIEMYPTWIMESGSSTQQFVGEQGLEKLSEISGCPLIK